MQQLATARPSGRGLRGIAGTLLTAFLVSLCAGMALAQTSLTALYDFRGVQGDGSHPVGDLSMDDQGVLYGVTTTQGGGGAKIYMLVPPAQNGGSWRKVTLYDGNAPGNTVHGNFTPVTLGKNGELYGVSQNCAGFPRIACIFQLAPPASSGGDWAMNVLSYQNNFEFGDGRILPVAGKLAIDSNGNLYGVTHRHHHSTYGAIYQLSPPLTPGGAWTRNVLYNFQRFPLIGSFWEPQDGLAIDGNGALYGSTLMAMNVAFQLAPPATAGGPWSLTFIGGGAFLNLSALTVAPSGAVYGVGFVFDRGVSAIEFAQSSPGGGWTTSFLPASFHGGGPGWELVSDKNGVLYGTDMGGQIVYKLTPPAISGGDWAYSILHTFSGGDGADPFSRLLVDSQGDVFGATLTGGSGTRCHNYPPRQAGCGTVFELQ